MDDNGKQTKERVADFWDSASAHWKGFSLPDADLLEHVLDALDIQPPGMVLDAGCGAGQWSVALALAGYKVSGVDISAQMVAVAQGKALEHGIGDAAYFQVGDVENLPFDGGTFDGIICRNVLDFAPNPGVALLEFRRVLKASGRLLVMTLGAYSPVRRHLWRRFLPGNNIPAIANHIVPWELEALLVELGWRIISQQPHFGPAASGLDNTYNAEMAAKLDDRILQQTIASSWEFVAEPA